MKTSHKKIQNPQNDKKKIEDSRVFFSLANGQVHVKKKIHNSSPQVKCFFTTLGSLKWMFLTFSGVTLITFFSLLMEGHFKWIFFFTPNGDQFKQFFFTPNGGSLQVTFFSPPMGGHFKWFFFVFHFNGGSFQRIFHSQGFYFFTFLVHRFWLFPLFNY